MGGTLSSLCTSLGAKTVSLSPLRQLSGAMCAGFMSHVSTAMASSPECGPGGDVGRSSPASMPSPRPGASWEVCPVDKAGLESLSRASSTAFPSLEVRIPVVSSKLDAASPSSCSNSVESSVVAFASVSCPKCASNSSWAVSSGLQTLDKAVCSSALFVAVRGPRFSVCRVVASDPGGTLLFVGRVVTTDACSISGATIVGSGVSRACRISMVGGSCPASNRAL
jgi:hypothetical protein